MQMRIAAMSPFSANSISFWPIASARPASKSCMRIVVRLRDRAAGRRDFRFRLFEIA
jgi:hypothetical protein